jgi:benzoylformate decarboxylase
MPRITGRKAFLELLKLNGVRYIFGNPGTTELPLMDALAAESGIRYILSLQEASAMSTADGYALAAQDLAVVNLHVAPGLGNAMGMLYDARESMSPIIVTAGQQDQRMCAAEPILWADLVDMARPLVKWSTEVRSLEDLPKVMHRAAKIAMTPPRGPVFVSLPMDVMNAEADIDLGSPTRIAADIRPQLNAVHDAARILCKSVSPVIVIGHAVQRSLGQETLARLAEMLGAPVYSEPGSHTEAMRASHPLFRGPLPRANDQIHKVLSEHDTLLSIGARLFQLVWMSDVEPMPTGLRLLQIDEDAHELGKNYAPEVAMLGSASAAMSEIADQIELTRISQQREAMNCRTQALTLQGATRLRKLEEKADTLADAVPIKPLALMRAVTKALPQDAVIVDETVSSGSGLRNMFKGELPQSYFGLRGGGIGWGLSAAIGVKLAMPDRPVFALIGDGSAMYSIQGLWTAAHEQLSIVFLIINNKGYRALKISMAGMQADSVATGRYVAMDLNNPEIDYVGLAAAMGVPGERVTDIVSLEGTLARIARDVKGPYLIDVRVDGSFKN